MEFFFLVLLVMILVVLPWSDEADYRASTWDKLAEDVAFLKVQVAKLTGVSSPSAESQVPEKVENTLDKIKTIHLDFADIVVFPKRPLSFSLGEQSSSA